MSKYVLMKNHCPCCFKHYKGCEYVKRDSELIDKVQLFCSSKNPMKLYDMNQPGEPCSKNNENCQITCLVCGKSVIAWDEWNFQRVRRFVIGDTERPVRKVDVKADILEKNSAVFVNWKTPVHLHCTHVADCGCRLVKGISCELHEKKKVSNVCTGTSGLLPEYEKLLKTQFTTGEIDFSMLPEEPERVFETGPEENNQVCFVFNLCVILSLRILSRGQS